MTAIEYAKCACDTLMKKFSAEDLPPKGKFHYHQGVFLSGMQKCYNLCKEEKYYDYIKAWVDSIVYEDGSVHQNDEEALDDLQPTLLLFDLYDRSGEERYKKVIERTVYLLKHWKTNKEGGFWHKGNCEDQMWLDGLYMAGPTLTQYGKRENDTECFDIMFNQAMLMKKHCLNPETGLYLHGWDCERVKPWANKETGCSAEHWGRAMGWYAVAMLDMLENIPQDYPNRKEMEVTVAELIKNIIKYQDKETGMWYQVVDKGDRADNWIEGSCSALYTYSIFKAIRMGIIKDYYEENAMRGYNGSVNAVKFDDEGKIIIDNVCIGTGISDYEYYINRPKGENDLHGMGAFILMCDEKAQYDILKEEKLC